MPPKDGAPADGNDVWLRNITNKKHVRPDGRLKSNAFTGKAIAPPQEARPWNHELSGRLHSLTTDFEAEGRAFCQDRGLSFVGVMHAPVEDLRRHTNGITTDVHYTPNDDLAHADLTMVGTNDDNLGAIRDWLQETVNVSLPNPKCVLALKKPQPGS